MRKSFKNILLLFLMLSACFIYSRSFSQELDATVMVRHQKIHGIESSVFTKMQTDIRSFLNTRQWTSISYKNKERINCRFLIDLQEEKNHVYKAVLTIQSSRPVFNTSYQTPVLNYKDKDVSFEFEPFTPLVFDKNRITGSNPLVSNLTAILAYYAYLIIGLDQDTFSKNGGHDAFKTAQKIVDGAPSGRKISGWKSYDGTLNRYWLIENLLNVRYKKIANILYQYHRKGLDLMYDQPEKGRKNIISCVNDLNALNADNPRLMFLEVFFATKADELANIFSKGANQDRLTTLNLLKKLDPSHSSLYRKSMKR